MGEIEDLKLPPGFRFHPSDEELVKHYLCRKCASQPIAVPGIIADIHLYKYHPSDLPDMALYGEKEWYFFSPRDRKYPNGSRPNRSAAAGSGYWKATGADKPIFLLEEEEDISAAAAAGRRNPKPTAIKKALVFYSGKAPKGDKTNWIMHEYRLANVDRSPPPRPNNNLRLDDWILCRIYNKKGAKLDKRRHKHQIINLLTNKEEEDDDKKPHIFTSLHTSPPSVLLNNDHVIMYPNDDDDDSSIIPKLLHSTTTTTTADSSTTSDHHHHHHDHVVSPPPPGLGWFTTFPSPDQVQSNNNAFGSSSFNYNHYYDTTSTTTFMDLINHPSSHTNYHLQDIFFDFQTPF